MSQRPATIYDVARLSGLSSATVSRVLTSRGYVSSAARTAVQDAIDVLGYVPSASGRGLASRRTAMIGLCLPAPGPLADVGRHDLTGPAVTTVVDDGPGAGVRRDGTYFDDVVRGAEHAAWQAGVALTLTLTRGEDTAARVQDVAGRVDGLVVLAETLTEDLLEHVARRVPVVSLAGPRTPWASDHVTAANGAGIEAVVQHLVAEHHVTDLTYVAGREGSDDDEDRFAAFRRAVRAAGLPVADRPRWRGDYFRSRARALGDEIAPTLVRGPAGPPPAFVCANDETALGLLDAFTAHGLRVPEDVLLTGFDGIDDARASAPALTTVEQPASTLGAVAVELVMQRISTPRARSQTVEVPVRLLLRGSCGTH